MRQFARRFWPALLLLAAILIVFWPALSGQPVSDEWTTLRDNPRIADWRGAPRRLLSTVVAWGGVEAPPNQYRPLPFLSWMIDYLLYGQRWAGFHFSNLLWHFLNSLLLFLLLRDWSGRTRLPAFAAAVFALHPQQVETVCWLSARPDLLLTAAALASLWLAWRRRPGWAAAAYFLALLAKETALVLPAGVAAFLWWAPQPIQGRARYLGRVLTAMGGACLIYLLLRWRVTDPAAAVIPGFWPSPQVWLSSAGIGLQLALFATPPDFMRLYQPAAAAGVAGGLLLLTGLLAALAARCRPAYGGMAAGLVFFLSLFLPLALYLPVSPNLADRFFYLPLAGLLAAACTAGQLVPPALRRAPWPGLGGLAGGLLLVMLGLTGHRQAESWRSEEALLTRSQSFHPDNPLVYSALGRHYARSGDEVRALAAFRRGLQLDPNQATPANELGLLLLKRQAYPEALAVFQTLVQKFPWFEYGPFNLALAQLGAGDAAACALTLGKLEARRPLDPKHLFYLGTCQLQAGQLRESATTLKRTVALNPRLTSAWVNLAWAQQRQGHFVEAAAALEKAAALAPRDAIVAWALARLYAGPLAQPQSACLWQRRARLLEPSPQWPADLQKGLRHCTESDKERP